MTTSALDDVVALIRQHDYRFTDERELEDALVEVLAHAYTVERQVAAGRDRFDLRLGTTVIEVKVGGGAAAALAQCGRYLTRDDVDSVILIGPPTWGSATMPRHLLEKPFRFVSIGRRAF